VSLPFSGRNGAERTRGASWKSRGKRHKPNVETKLTIYCKLLPRRNGGRMLPSPPINTGERNDLKSLKDCVTKVKNKAGRYQRMILHLLKAFFLPLL